MGEPLSRRCVLHSVVAGVSITSLAGCSALDSEPSLIPVEIANYTPERHEITVDIIDRDAEDRSDGTVLREVYKLEPYEDGKEYTVPDVPTVPNRPYIVRAKIDAKTPRHYHYIPDCKTRENREDKLYLSVQPTENGATVRFYQDGCR